MAYSYFIYKPRACVKVMKKNTRQGVLYVVQPGIFIIDGSVKVMELTKGKVVDEDGNELPATGKYLITSETIDPYHLVTDYF